MLFRSEFRQNRFPFGLTQVPGPGEGGPTTDTSQSANAEQSMQSAIGIWNFVVSHTLGDWVGEQRGMESHRLLHRCISLDPTECLGLKRLERLVGLLRAGAMIPLGMPFGEFEGNSRPRQFPWEIVQAR